MVLRKPGPRSLPAMAAAHRRQIAVMACLLVMLVVSYIFVSPRSISTSSVHPNTNSTLLRHGVTSVNPLLTVVTRISPSTYYLAPVTPSKLRKTTMANQQSKQAEQPHGFEYQLLSIFADELGRDLNIVTAESLEQLFNHVDNSTVNFASASLTPTALRAKRYQFSKPYLTDQAIVVYRVGKLRPRSTKDLVGHNIVVTANSSHSQYLRELQNEMPELHWREMENVNFVDLLGRVERGEVDYTIIDASEFSLHQGSFPAIKKAFNFGDSQPVSWMFAKNKEGSMLRKKANAFIQRIEGNGTLAKLEERYFGQTTHVNQVAAYEFAKNVDTKLNRYIDAIQTTANEAGVDWRLLAAMSYQESGWNPLARSPTGVRGMMMLTRPTAKELGVTDRLDLMQSLQGGARYYLNLKHRLPQSIKEPDRSWFALAAYNVGFGHLEDARKIADRLQKDPNSWLDVKQTLPLLTKAKWYRQTRYGYARGYEPVQYVQQIRHYQKVLAWNEMAVAIASNSIANDSSYNELKPIGDMRFQWSSAFGSSSAILASGMTLAENSMLDSPTPNDAANKDFLPNIDSTLTIDNKKVIPVMSPVNASGSNSNNDSDSENTVPSLTQASTTNAASLPHAVASR